MPILLLLTAAIPVLLLPGALLPVRWADRHPRRVRRLVPALAFAALVAAVAAAAGLALRPAGARSVAGWGLRLDPLAATMLVLVSFLGWVVARYAVNYLDGDARQGRFFTWLAETLAAVLLTVAAGHFAVLVAAWIATSLGLHKLLRFYPARPAAQIAARKKFLSSRLGDLCLIAAGVCGWRAFGTLDLGAMFAQLPAPGAPALAASHPATAMALLLALGAMLKSALVPFHSWLPDTMEAPTPVSALMHAGIINGGGYLLLRFSPLMNVVPAALHLVALSGLVTAVLAALVMLTQTSVKRGLAYSTIAQMGFMMVQCGLGAWTLAALHVVAHSLYKAHAFLTAGGVLQRRVRPLAGPSPAPRHLVLILAVSLAVGGGLAWVAGYPLRAQPALASFASIVAMGAAYYAWRAQPGRFGRRHLGRAVAAAAGVLTAYLLLALGAHALLDGTLAPAPAADVMQRVLFAAVPLVFAAVLLVQANLPALARTRAGRALYVALLNGGYVGAWLNRRVARLTLDPA